jgi:hypothetical protein
MSIAVYDPPLCCSTGVCGPSIDPALVQFAADLEWLAGQGVAVERHNLAQQPAAFVAAPAVTKARAEHGDACLPLTLVDGLIVCRGRYPTRAMLAGFGGLAPQSGPSAPRPRTSPGGGGGTDAPPRGRCCG